MADHGIASVTFFMITKEKCAYRRFFFRDHEDQLR